MSSPCLQLHFMTRYRLVFYISGRWDNSLCLAFICRVVEGGVYEKGHKTHLCGCGGHIKPNLHASVCRIPTWRTVTRNQLCETSLNVWIVWPSVLSGLMLKESWLSIRLFRCLYLISASLVKRKAKTDPYLLLSTFLVSACQVITIVPLNV